MAATSFAISDTFAKLVFAAGGDVLTLALSRGVVGLGILFVYLRVGPPPIPDTPRTRVFGLALGLLFAAVVYGLFKAIELTNVPVAVLTYFIYPLLTGIAGAAFGIERQLAGAEQSRHSLRSAVSPVVGADPHHLGLEVMLAVFRSWAPHDVSAGRPRRIAESRSTRLTTWPPWCRPLQCSTCGCLLHGLAGAAQPWDGSRFCSSASAPRPES